ncbi:MAG: hypothetical protein ACTSWX_00270 [Promethearchaeota archaeon]
MFIFSPTDQWPSDVLKDNQTYHDETGFWMKGIDVMNRTESFHFQNWIENRTASAMNICYDWFKTKNPNWEVGWNTHISQRREINNSIIKFCILFQGSIIFIK